MSHQTPTPSNPKVPAQSQQKPDQKGQYSGQSNNQSGGQMSSPTTSHVGNNIEKDEPLAQGSGGMKSEG